MASRVPVLIVLVGVLFAPVAGDKASAQLRELAGPPSCGAQNASTPTSCAEEDNINVPLYAGRVERFQIVAMHPSYSVGTDNCDADFSTCNFLRTRTAADTCERLLDDGTNVVQLCTVPNWWRRFAMSVDAAGGRTASGHYVVLYRKISDEASWPQFLVLYQDGNLRLKPHPQRGAGDPCFSSSVILGPAVSAARPFVDIERIRVTPSPLALDVTFRDGQGTAHLDLAVDRTRAIVMARVGYATGPAVPFATFRSMWVSNGNADVDHVQTEDGLFPILSDWRALGGRSWFFHRRTRSRHNTSGPDIRIEANDSVSQLVPMASPSALRRGDALELAAKVMAAEVPVPVDAYIAAQLPSGTVLFLQRDGSLVTDRRPFVERWTPADVRGRLVSRAFAGWEPAGTYQLASYFAEPGNATPAGCLGRATFAFTP